jgi:monoamine oxidase
LEASDRIGGRLRTEKVSNSYYDYGGTWVGPNQKYILKYIEKYNIKTYKQYTKGYSVLEIYEKVISYSDIPWYTSNIFGIIETQLCLWVFLNIYFKKRTLYNLIHKTKDKKSKTLKINEVWNHQNAKLWDSMSVETYLSKLWTQTAYDMIKMIVHTIFGCEPCELSFLFFLHCFNCSGGVDSVIGDIGGAQDSLLEGTYFILNKMVLIKIILK